MSDELPAWFVRAFTMPRLTPYVQVSQRDAIQTTDLYLWNLQVSEAFYVPLHCLEISLRNSVHEQLGIRYRRPDWWNSAPLAKHDAFKVNKAKDDLRRKGVPRPSADDTVAELSFGFWVSLLNRRYDRHFWVPALHKAFHDYNGDRENLRDNFQAMVLLRNRIMHHEPIHHRHLAADHAKIYRLLGYIEPEIVRWLRAFDRVPDVIGMRLDKKI